LAKSAPRRAARHAAVAAGVAVFGTLLALGMRDMYALVSYLLAGFVFGTIIQEFVKGVKKDVKVLLFWMR
jgi:ABC-type uncharacterized transport system permease subunit